METTSFKQEHDLGKRCAEAARIREKIPESLIDFWYYLVPAGLTVGQFVNVIRKRIKLSAEKAIFMFVDNVLPPTGAIMSAIYD